MRRSMRLVALAVALPFLPATGQVLGPEFRVNTYTTNAQYKSRIAASPNGDFVVVWQSTNQETGPSAADGVFAQPFDISIALGTELQINSYTSNQQNIPDVASDSNGNFVVVWRDYQEGSSFGVFARRFNSSGFAQGAEFRVNAYTSSNQGFAHVAATPAGSFVVVWQGIGPGGEYGIFGQRFDNAAAALGGEFQINTYTTGLQRPSVVASDSAGNFMVVWVSPLQDGDNDGVFGQRYNSTGAPLGGEFLVNTYTTGSQNGPAVAAAPGGGFIVVWQASGISGGPFGQRYDGAGAPLGGEFRVNAYTTSGLHPAVASDADGSFAVVWAGSLVAGGSDEIVGQVFASNGAPLGTEFRVNTYTSNSQTYPAVASRGAGDFVVVWRSSNQDGSGYGVFRKGLCMDPLVSVTISAMGSTTVCSGQTAGTLTVAEVGGGSSKHRQWQFETMSGGSRFDLAGQTGLTYTIAASDFPMPGTYFVVCTTVPPPDCGSFTVSNEIQVTVTTDAAAGPTVTAPAPVTLTQTLCQ